MDIYDQLMSLRQCQALIFLERTPSGSRILAPPRYCRRVALDDSDFCEVHEDHADLQELYHQILRPGFTHTIERWERDRARREDQGR